MIRLDSALGLAALAGAAVPLIYNSSQGRPLLAGINPGEKSTGLGNASGITGVAGALLLAFGAYSDNSLALGAGVGAIGAFGAMKAYEQGGVDFDAQLHQLPPNPFPPLPNFPNVPQIPNVPMGR